MLSHLDWVMGSDRQLAAALPATNRIAPDLTAPDLTAGPSFGLLPLLVALALPIMLFFSGSAAVAQDTSVSQDAYVLGSGDRVRVTVFGEADLSGEFQIDGQGSFPMPLIGTIEAAGKSPRALEQHMIALFRDGYLVNPQVGIEVLNFRPFFILGEVRNPGSFPYREGLTVLNAVALAGGFTFRADEDDIEITRGGDTDLPPNEATLETLVQPGDLIRVTERFF